MIDYSRTPATYWPKWSGMHVWPNEEESNGDLARINADGGHRELGGYDRVADTTEGSQGSQGAE
jgi:hypothetical protein